LNAFDDALPISRLAGSSGISAVEEVGLNRI
jgi:hypothetical protein